MPYQRTIADCFWDLRDDACDHPDRWEGVSAEEIFQRLGQFVGEAEEQGRPIQWGVDVARRAIEWRETGAAPSSHQAPPVPPSTGSM